MTDSPPLSQGEYDLLLHLLADPRDAAARNLLTFCGASSATGLLARLEVSGNDERAVLLKIIRRAIASASRRV